MKIITWENNPILRKISVTIDDFKDVKKIEKSLKTSLAKHEQNWVWLSAPQIWINKRIFIGMFDKEKLTTVINPKIIKYSQKTEIAQEWCLSLPWLWWDVERSLVIQVEYYTNKWEKVIENLDKFPAKVFQHEFDHLEWILFIDRVIGDIEIDESLIN